MVWMNFIYLGSGLSAGLAIGWLLWRSKTQRTVSPQPQDVRSASNRQQPSDLAYQMAVEMNQFKGGFLARTSHELRSPLNGIIGVHQLILADLCETPAEEHEFIAQAHESALRMVQMLDEVIQVAKMQHGSKTPALQPVQVLNVLHDVDSLTHLLAQDRNLRLKIELPDPDLYVMADPHWLKQVFVSLVNGAIHQMQEGKIRLFVSAIDAEYAHILLEDDRPAETWSEPIDLMHSAQQVDWSLKPPNAPKEFSPNFHLMLNQALLEAMRGRLELLKASGSAETITCIRCSIPLVLPDA